MSATSPSEPARADQPFYLMSPPRPDWGLRGRANFRSQAAGGTDARKARTEWARLADAIVAAGGEVVVCPPHPEQNLTGMIYTAEAGELYRDEAGNPGFLLPNMAAEHRRGEAAWIGPFFEDVLGISTRRVEASWEAQGDAIRGASAHEIVHTYGVGPAARTEEAAYSQIAPLLSPRHIQVEFVADPWFHGNTFLNVYRRPEHDASLLVVCPDALSHEDYERLRAFLPDAQVLEITREQSLGYDTNALQVGDTVLAPTTLSGRTRDALIQLGLEVEAIDLGELFVKGGGAPVCLTNRLWDIRDDEVPDEVRWSAHPNIDAHTRAK